MDMRLNLICLLSITVTIEASLFKNNHESYLENPAVKKFQEYVQIDTSKDENLQYAVEFWKRQAEELRLNARVFSPAGKPICIITIPGQQPELPAIMLNSHMDVVPANKNEWTYPPYSAYMDEKGDIYGRGTQDTKDVAIQYIEAIARLMKDNATMLRTVHITLMPDEETGGYEGMQSFLRTEEFTSLNIGFALDEGLTSSNNELIATYVDRRPFQIEFIVTGESGHGFKMPDNTAAEKLLKLLTLIMDYREKQKKTLKSNKAIKDGYSTSVNVNIIRGGVAANVIPSNFTVTIDMRLSVDAKVQDIDNMIQSWMDQSGAKITKYIRREEKSIPTRVDNSNPYWVALRDAVDAMGYNVKLMVCPATSDMTYLRNYGIPALGFSTKTNAISRIHGKNEYQNVKTFLKGIDVYYNVIHHLANIPDFEEACVNSDEYSAVTNRGYRLNPFLSLTNWHLL